MIERIVAKVLKIGNGLFSGGDTIIEFDIGDGVTNPKIKVSDSTDFIEVDCDVAVVGNLSVTGDLTFDGSLTGDLDIIGVLSVDGDPVLTSLDGIVDSNIAVGVNISGSKLQAASASNAGAMSTADQAFAGRKTGNGYLPSGVVLPFAGSSTPSDFLLCDGTDYLIATYPALSAVLGTTYNTQINPTTGAAWAAPTAGRFRVPDYRSMFLRGVGTSNLSVAVSLGGWQDDATAKNALVNASSSLTGSSTTASSTGTGSTGTGTTGGGTTGNDSPDHSHNAASGTLYNFRAGSFMGSSTPIRDFDTGTPATGGASARHTHSIPGLSVPSLSVPALSIPSLTVNGTASAQTISSTDVETRPQNKGVNYIIKT